MRPFLFDRQQMAGGIRLRGGEVLTPKVGNIACAAGAQEEETNGFSPLVNHPTSFRTRCARKNEVPVSGCRPARRIRTTLPGRPPE